MRSRRKRNGPGFGFWVLVFAFLVVGLAYLAGSPLDLTRFLRPLNLWTKLGEPLLRSLAFIALGLLAGQFLESLGWSARLGRLVWPLLSWSRLPGPAGMAFTSAFVSGVLANTLLYTSWQEGRLTKRGLIMANLLCNSLPVYFLHLPTTLFVAFSLTGSAGLWYLGLMLVAAFFRLIGVTVASRFIMPTCEECALESPAGRRPLGAVWAETWPKFRDRLKRLVLIIIPVYIAVAVLAESGFFTWLRDASAHWVAGTFLPVESMGLVIFAVMAEFTTGFAAAGALLQAGTLTIKQVALALLIGNVVATPVRALRHQLPQYMGIYSPGLGLQVMVLTQIVRVASVVLVTALFAWLY